MISLGRSLPGSLGALLFLASVVPAQHVTAPMLPYKDGDVSLKSCEGEDEELLVTDEGGSGRKEKRNIAWITFLSQTVDMEHASRAVLSLNLSGLRKSGTLHVHALTSPIPKLEDKVGWADVRFDSSRPVASMPIDRSMVDMIINLDITPAIKAGPFHGLVLVGDGLLQAAFSSRESGMPPMIQLHYPALTGPPGPKGEDGVDGKDGRDGIDGRDGVDGKDGVAGATGPMGPIGPQGIPGEMGPMGPQGPVGATGPAGPIGPQGIQGETGAMGPMGPQGIQGETGATGPMGPQGIQGLTGATGPMGPQGIQGEMGPMGMQGIAGEAGPMGPAGPEGPAGPGTTAWLEDHDTVSTLKRVGIGTENPQSKLHVVGDVTVSGTIRGATWGFGGMFQRDDCSVNNINNPLTGALACPAGFTSYRIGRVLAPESGCGANQFICIK